MTSSSPNAVQRVRRYQPQVPASDDRLVHNHNEREEEEIVEDDDQEKDDPDIVDDVLSRELMNLSVRNRTDFQEEIHGVLCLAPKETPELLEQSLNSLQWELDHGIPADKKQAYLQSRQLPETYVNTDDFRLRFLRCELFDVPRAALRMVRFLDLAKELYGDFALQRPIKLTDFSKQELKFLRKGHYQFLPYRDRGGIVGRRVLSIFPDCEWELFPPYLRNKILIYFTWTAGNDVAAQREGIVFLFWFDATAKVSRKPAIQAKDHEVLTCRASAIHCCSPDTPLYRFRRSIMTMRIGRQNRTRLVVHLGNSVEIRFKLQSYGIPPDQIPITYAGKIKNIYVKQWMKLREYIEEQQQQVPSPTKHPQRALSPAPPPTMSGSPRRMIFRKHSLSSLGSFTSSDGSDCGLFGNGFYDECDSPRIESPFKSDIIFRKGTSLVSHPGNTNLRTIIVAKAQKELLESQEKQKQQQSQSQSQQQPNSKQVKQHQTRRFVSDIIRELRETSRANEAAGTGRACRFLAWDEGGWWTELFQEQEIHTRVEYIARGIRNTVQKNHRACSLCTKDDAETNNNNPNPNSSKSSKSSMDRDATLKTGAAGAAADLQNQQAQPQRPTIEKAIHDVYKRRSSETGASTSHNHTGGSMYNRRGSLGSSTASGHHQNHQQHLASKPALMRRNSIHNVYKRRDNETIAIKSSVYNRPASETNMRSIRANPGSRRRNSIHSVYKRRDSVTSATSGIHSQSRRGSETSTTSTFKRRGSETSTTSTQVFHRRGSETSTTSGIIPTTAPSSISFPTPEEGIEIVGDGAAADIFEFSNPPPGNLKKRRTGVTSSSSLGSLGAITNGGCEDIEEECFGMKFNATDSWSRA